MQGLYKSRTYCKLSLVKGWGGIQHNSSITVNFAWLADGVRGYACWPFVMAPQMAQNPVRNRRDELYSVPGSTLCSA